MLDDLSTGFAETIPAGVEFHQLPVHQVGQVLTPDAGFDGVLHFAAKIEVAESVARPDLYWDVNVGGTMALLAAVRVAGVPRMIFSSTGSMYDPAGVVPLPGGGFSKLDEDAVIRPKNPYAATKLAVDLMLAGECEAFGLGAASLRYFNASGAVGRLGERHTPESHLIPIVLQVAGGQAGPADDVRRRLPDTGRHLRARLHPRRRPGHRAPARAGARSSRAGTRSTTWATATATASGRSSTRPARSPATPSRSSWPRAAPATRPPRSPPATRPAATWAGSPARPALQDIIADAWAFHQSVWS